VPEIDRLLEASSQSAKHFGFRAARAMKLAEPAKAEPNGAVKAFAPRARLQTSRGAMVGRHKLIMTKAERRLAQKPVPFTG
jgi:hypothetical protein